MPSTMNQPQTFSENWNYPTPIRFGPGRIRPNTLADLAVREEHVEELTEKAVVDPSGATNPVPLNASNLAGLYRVAISGELR